MITSPTDATASLHHHAQSTSAVHVAQVSLMLAIAYFLLSFAYAALVLAANRKYAKPWPASRSLCWHAGMTLAAGSCVSPLIFQGSNGFARHMVAHLLLGMFVPLLLVYAAPVTLLLRSLPAPVARSFMRLLKRPVMRIIVHPAVGAIVNVGSMWTLYRTSLYAAMHELPVLYATVHVHFPAAGYLFTASVLRHDRWMHDWGFCNRIFWLIISMAGHGILSKGLFASPPAGVPADQAEFAARMMYYGGDVVEITLILILCYQRYHAPDRLKQSSVTSA
ncbi:cytochrome c oxidase assembly protein [Paenibacillus methanolicus]|uniref:Putative membrane protein n=1 Tax=Paenibacillus methanolicus TaxID=582686 RepID=A0A5S5CJB0_9BACL|nr:cytochrome c oxidase assembly protein [Paenibacillus methanolicus]TYP79782.1 putative membrane protein [Paenibacillus methanolicus]